MPFEVAPAPVPSWETSSEAGGRVGSEGAQPSGAGSSAVPKSHGLDAAFLCRLHRTIAWFGALATFLVATLTARSGQQPAVSFASGLLIGWGLLATQGFVVGRAMGGARSRGKRGRRSRQMAWWLLVPVKYLAVAALLGWLLNGAKLPAAWLALGFGTVQLVLLAKAMGYVLSGSVRTVRQAYIRPGSD